MAQDALNRWWWPALMMFGPHDTDSPRSSIAIKWKIKRETNDNLREKFIQKTIPQAELIGLKIPDENLKIRDDGTYSHGEIDWEEFSNVIHGNGPCNEQRIMQHRKAHQEGYWVRESANQYGKKQGSI